MNVVRVAICLWLLSLLSASAQVFDNGPVGLVYFHNGIFNGRGQGLAPTPPPVLNCKGAIDMSVGCVIPGLAP